MIFLVESKRYAVQRLGSAVFEDLNDPDNTRNTAGDLCCNIGFLSGDSAHQIDIGSLGDDFDLVPVEVFRVRTDARTCAVSKASLARLLKLLLPASSIRLITWREAAYELAISIILAICFCSGTSPVSSTTPLNTVTLTCVTLRVAVASWVSFFISRVIARSSWVSFQYFLKVRLWLCIMT